jgi:thymidylate synthase ThyX
MISATVIADSMSPTGKRLTTLSLTYPRFILAELNTHRQLSRNSASSRAIPTKKLIQEIQDNPAMPVFWGRNQSGMQAAEEIALEQKSEAIDQWLLARDSALLWAKKLSEMGLHKQIVNRILEPFMHARTVVTATEWDNFYMLRRHKDAQPEIKSLADAMWAAMQESSPIYMQEGDWHLPYSSMSDSRSRSVARCARVSYCTHEGKETTREQDAELAQRLRDSGHWSPFEHQATPKFSNNITSNLRGWKQLREILIDDHKLPIS